MCDTDEVKAQARVRQKIATDPEEKKMAPRFRHIREP